MGEPGVSAALDDDLASGRIVLGGCVIEHDQVPEHACRACGAYSVGSRVVGYREMPGGARPIGARLSPPTSDAQHLVGRLVLTGDASSDKPGRRSVASRRWLLDTALHTLIEAKVTVTYLVMPAGFIKGSVPIGVRSHGWKTQLTDFEALADAGKVAARALFDDETMALARQAVSYLVLGVDLYTSGGRNHEPHGELAVVYDVEHGSTVAVTGKSYPTSAQERVLIRNPTPQNHLVKVDGHRVAVLVCHDLMAWGGRSEITRRGPRATAATELQTAVGDADVALHLPHTVSTASWTDPWRKFRAEHPGLKGWGSAILYRTTDDRHRPDKPLSEHLLTATGAAPQGSLAIILGDA